MSIIIDIADAVVEELNEGTFSAPFEAKRYYRPVFALKDMDTLHVSVVPKAQTIERADRRSNQHALQVDVAVQKRFDGAEGAKPPDAQADALMALVEEIGDFFRLRRLTACPAAVWVRTDNVPVYAPEHIEEFGQFTSVLTLTFRMVR